MPSEADHERRFYDEVRITAYKERYHGQLQRNFVSLCKRTRR